MSHADTFAASAAGLGGTDRKRLCAGEGTEGPRLSDRADLELAVLLAAEFGAAPTSLRTRGLLIRRDIADGALA